MVVLADAVAAGAGAMGKKAATKSKEEPLEIECTINLGKKLVRVYVN